MLFVGAYVAGSCSGKSDIEEWRNKYKQYYEEAQTTKKTAEQLKKTSDSLATLAKSKDAKIDSLKAKADRLGRDRNGLGRELGQLEGQLETIGSLAPSIDSLTDTSTANRIRVAITKRDTIISKQKVSLAKADSQIVSLNDSFKQQKERVGLLEHSLRVSNDRGDSLQVVVNNLPKAPKNPNKLLGFIPIPSRTTVAIVSLAAGTYIGSQLSK